MNRSIRLSAIALALCAAGAAHAADGVTIYGIIDAGVRAANNQATPTATPANPDSGTRLSGVSGGLMTSRLGFKGSEDLGSGLKAVFQLESGLSINNGTTDTAFFNRISHIGLASANQAVYLGRDYNMTYVSLGEVDPLNFRAPGINPNVQVGGLNDTTTWGNPLAGQTDARTNSAVTYEGNSGALKGAAQYSFGGVAGSNSANSGYGARLSYDLGYALLSGSATRMNDSTGSHLSAYSLGGKWRYSEQLALSATYASQSVSGGATDGYTRHLGSIGAYYTPGSMTYGVAYYGTRAESVNGVSGVDGRQDKLVGLAAYNLSKRTSVYGTVDYAHNKDALVPANTSQANGAGLTVGVNHMF